MLEEKIVKLNLEYLKSNPIERSYNEKEQKEDLKERVFQEIKCLINEKQTYMLGIEKAIVVRFISQNFIDVYEILKNLIEKEIQKEYIE